MKIETAGPSQPLIKIDGDLFTLNIKECESLIIECHRFMDVDPASLQVMTQIISDRLIDSAHVDTQMEELRVQLKFLRELGFFLRGIFTPAERLDQG